jgi:hypothetical protein
MSCKQLIELPSVKAIKPSGDAYRIKCEDLHISKSSENLKTLAFSVSLQGGIFSSITSLARSDPRYDRISSITSEADLGEIKSRRPALDPIYSSDIKRPRNQKTNRFVDQFWFRAVGDRVECEALSQCVGQIY